MTGVLVHGTTQSVAGFWCLVRALEQRGHGALTVDVPSASAASSIEHADLLAARLPGDLREPVCVHGRADRAEPVRTAAQIVLDQLR